MKTKTTVSLCVSLMLLGSLAGCSSKDSSPTPSQSAQMEKKSRPGGTVASMSTVRATITDIDYENRKVSLRAEDGRTARLHVGEEARNFKQAKKGDKVDITFMEALAIDVQPDDGSPLAGDIDTTIDRARLGEKPGGVMTKTITLKAEVKSIDYTNRTVTLKGPEGDMVTLKVGEGARRFNEVKTGDRVAVVYTEALAISVSKPGA